ncbi:unnamed protein product [Trichobilharzia regenti]|nr:unnamed protein product [Trichobilharzia regenti]
MKEAEEKKLKNSLFTDPPNDIFPLDISNCVHILFNVSLSKEQEEILSVGFKSCVSMEKVKQNDIEWQFENLYDQFMGLYTTSCDR